MKNIDSFREILGIKLLDLRDGYAKLSLEITKEHTNALGAAHGGAIFSLADSAVAMAMVGLVERDEQFTTVEMKINYVIPFEKGVATAEARIINKGSRIALGDVDIRDEQGRLIAKSLSTYMIMK